MAPIIKSINDEALQPYLTSEIGQREAFEKALSPIRDFMLKQTRTDDIQLMQRLSGLGAIESKADLPTHVLIPSFIISELTTAFTIGFLLFIPFLVIDMVVASILMAMGMHADVTVWQGIECQIEPACLGFFAHEFFEQSACRCDTFY